MWRYCLILALWSGLLLLSESRHHSSVELEASATEELAHAEPAAIMFGNPQYRKRLWFGPRKHNRDQGKRDKKGKRHKQHSSTRAPIRNSFKHH